ICSENRTEIEILGSFAGPFQSRNPFPHPGAELSLGLDGRDARPHTIQSPHNPRPHTIQSPHNPRPHTILSSTESRPHTTNYQCAERAKVCTQVASACQAPVLPRGTRSCCAITKKAPAQIVARCTLRVDHRS